jgi:hypothetical protein
VKLVKEHKPGATGRMSHSFTGQYLLCERCLKKVADVGGVEKEVWYGNGRNRKRYAYTVVKAKTFAWLRLQSQARGRLAL